MAMRLKYKHVDSIDCTVSCLKEAEKIDGIYLEIVASGGEAPSAGGLANMWRAGLKCSTLI